MRKIQTMTRQLAILGAAVAFSMSLGMADAKAAGPAATIDVGDPVLRLAQYTGPYEEPEVDEGGGGGYGGGGYGGGGGGYGGGYGGGGGGGDRISCWRGRRIVERSGFYRVAPRDCGGRNYTYSAFRRGRPWIVRLNSFSGRIIAARPAGEY
jgi:hypothetical protein